MSIMLPARKQRPSSKGFEKDDKMIGNKGGKTPRSKSQRPARPAYSASSQIHRHLTHLARCLERNFASMRR
jgi:hypothetical protein